MSLEISGITKSYGRYPALNDVSLFAEDGEFLALLGPSGSGKTTLLRAIAGLEEPEAGSVRFRGDDLLAKRVRDRGIGFVFQHYALFKHMTAAANVAFGMRSKPRKERASSEAIDRRVAELLDLVQLEGYGARYPSQLSGGQRQRVALARALAIEPRILLLDEPFGALDAKVRRGLRRWLRELHERTGITTIFVTHDQEEALELADRVAILKDGRIEQIGTPEELYHEPATPFVFDFLGESVQFPCEVRRDVAHVAGAAVPIIGGSRASDGPATAFVRPDAFDVGPADGPGLRARVRDVLLAGPDARIDCVIEGDGSAEVRVPHEVAKGLAPRDQITLTPRAARVWS